MADFQLILRLIVFHVVVSPFISTPVTGKPQNILILGGNGLLGGHTVRRLHASGHRLTVINRGNEYWDWSTQLHKNVGRSLRCDRKNRLFKCEAFESLVLESKPKFDLAIDFSGFAPQMIDNSMEDIYGFVNNYLFISTDSVYEVSAKKSHKGPTREEDAKRPTDASERLQYAIKDQYAEDKFRCEERLQDYAVSKNLSVLSLRLPDVLGARDSTVRFWAYMAIMEIADFSKQALKLPAFSTYWPMSFVYADDVGRLIASLVDNNTFASLEKGKVLPVNFANPETLTLQALLQRTSEIMGLKNLKFQVADDPNALMPRYLIPSVSLGPLDVSRAKAMWKFSHAPWDSVLKPTIQYYQQYLKKARAENRLSDPVLARLRENIDYLDGLRIFDKNVWRQYLEGDVKIMRPKQEL